MKLFIILVCMAGFAAVQCAKKPKKDKNEKKVAGLCNAYEDDKCVVEDSVFDDVFGDDMMGVYCDAFFNTTGSLPKPARRNIDGVKTLGKICKMYMGKYVEEPVEGPMVGLAAICNASVEAAGRSLNDKTSRKALASLNGLCVAMDAGKVSVSVSNYSRVFEALEGFCDAFMNETEETMNTKRRGDNLNGIKVLGGICRWYSDKFDDDYEPEGSLGDLDDICEDYDDIFDDLEDDDDDDGDDDDDDGLEE